ncbi:maleylpyruvate isomerase family mycothiol-dependent enzyme [Mycobacterium sp.]|uniref:maleylpyruvate isomerase family mycothiol-dependent enzyme n=1 Tax=Mycobacterium sp. TaxID=1785 RepID=UPI0011F448A4|nr:maleylpyruvate isomerase family mycothiol-dependent enzyme [Mycobacterium sp.]TAM69006.1 MAG: maleylpyruvate isomerase family mycothiol-dependent enzyme [Mycobacterium sp.]
MADRRVTKLDKSAVLSGLFAVWDDIDALLAGLSETQWRAASPLPGWDVKALVSHMIGTESFLAGIAAPQPDIDVSALEHVRNDIGAMNECWVRHLGAHADADVLESFRAITNDRRTALTNLSDEEWDAVTPTPTGPDTYGRFMRIRVFDCWMHEQDIRVALGRPPSDDELARPAASLAVDEMGATMGYVVGRLARAPEGSRVQFELTGPLARTIRVSVDGRAAVVDDFAGREPTATIRLDGLQFTRLAGGRPMCPARRQDVELGGDKEVAAQIVEHLNFVI